MELDQGLVPWDYWMNDWPDEDIVWTRANLKDQAPRPLTPLTQDLIQTFEPEGMLKALADVFGLVDRAALGRHITGFYGALYLSVPNSAILGDATPGSSAHIKFEQFFGLTRAPGWVPPPPVRTPEEEAQRKEQFEALIQCVAEQIPGAIEKLFDAVASLRPADDLTTLPWTSMADWFDGLNELQADCFALLVEGANVASLAYAKAGAALAQHGLDADGSLLTSLHVGLGGNDSAEMGSAVMDLARAGQQSPGFARLYEAFMQEFGHRGPGELMLEKKSWRADPGALLALVDRGAGSKGVPEGNHEEAWATLRSQNGGDLPAHVEALITYSQSVMAARENAKNPIVKLFDEIRLLVSVAAQRLIASGDATREDDLLFHNRTEFRRVLGEGAAVVQPEEITARRAAYTACLDLNLPELVESVVGGGLRLPTAEYFDRLGFLPPAIDGGALHPSTPLDERPESVTGIGAAPGVVIGTARIMRDALDDFEPGDVLIAETVDPGWSPILAAAGAVVLDIGGRLSHGAVVARELGVPCVVNTKLAMSTFFDGQLVRVDGVTGEVSVA